MANLHIIKDLAVEKKTTLKKIAEVIGITEAGLHGAINKGDTKFSYVDRIANYLQVDVSVFSDFSTKTKPDSGVIVNGQNAGNIAGGNIVQVALPEAGNQKIIKPDGTITIEPISTIHNGDTKHENLLELVETQKLLIQSLREQLAFYKAKND